MKKRNVFVSFIFTLLMCFSLSFSAGAKKAFAEGESTEITITFNALGGTTDATPITIQSGDAIGTLPTAQKDDFYFRGWTDGSSMIEESTTFSKSTELSAVYVKKNYEYIISDNTTSLTIKAKTAESDFDYYLFNELGEECVNLQEALALILVDLDTKASQTTITFDNLTLSENLDLAIQNVTLTGTLNLGEYSICYTPPLAGLSSLGLSDITLNSTSSQDLVKILGANSSNINVSSAVFASGSADNNYSIYLENPVHKLKFDNTLSYSSKYLFNFEKTTRYATFANSFSLTSPSKILVTIPYYVDEQPILQTYLTSEYFEFIPNQSNFTCSVISKSNGQDYVCARTNFDILFNENGGTIAEAFPTTNLKYYLATKLDFPTEVNYQKEHFYLDGFVAKITDNTTDWYFDMTALNNYLSDTTNPTFEEYFYSSVPAPDSTSTGFTYFKYTTSSDDLNFLATDFMLKLNKTPTFVALWKNIQYSISFEENGGTVQQDKSGIFGSALTLPTSSDISKTGYDFVGWFTSSALAEIAYEGDKVDPSNYLTMPDTNPTLYAGWKIRSHKIFIYKNNQTAAAEISVNFGTQISSLQELDSTLLARTGYTFAGWFTDELFANILDESQTMPDSDFSVYANWTINQYTITLYLNHVTDDSVYKTATRNFNSDIRDIFSESPSFIGYTFEGWFTDNAGRYPFTDLPEMMPAENITLYAHFEALEHRLTLHFPAFGETDTTYLNYDDELTLLYPIEAGYIFDGWYADENFTEEFTLTKMPNSDLHVYAKYTEKSAITLEINPQTYSFSENKGFILDSNIDGFIVEYLVNGEWTKEAPTAKGSYDVKISRAEDSVFKLYVKTFENALVITADELNISIYSLILYCIAALELICSIIVLFIRKQRKTYLTYAIALPFGVVPTSQFVNLIVSLVLAVFGLVLLAVQLTKLKKVNNEISKISTENKEYTPPDVSEDKSISKKVEILLKQQGFVSATADEDESEEDDEHLTIIGDDDEDKVLKSENDDEYLSFDSSEDKNNPNE